MTFAAGALTGGIVTFGGLALLGHALGAGAPAVAAAVALAAAIGEAKGALPGLDLALPSRASAPASPGSISSIRAKCGCAATRAWRNASRLSKGRRLPRTSDSARRIAQSSRASPGGNTARFARCTRPSVFT